MTAEQDGALRSEDPSSEKIRKTQKDLHHAGDHRGEGNAEDAKPWRPEQSEDKYRVQKHIEKQGGAADQCARPCPLHTLQHAEVGLGKPCQKIGDTDDSQIGSPHLNQFRVRRKDPHQKSGERDRRKGEQECERHGYLQGDAEDRLDRIHILFSPVLSAEHGSPGGDPKEKAAQNKLILVCQGDSRHGGLPYIVEHQHVGRIYHVCDQVLNRYRNDQRKKRSVKKFLLRCQCFTGIHNAESIADKDGVVKKKPVKKYFRCCLFRTGCDTIYAKDGDAFGAPVQMKKGGMPMKIIITGKNLEVSEGLKNAVEEKIGKLEKYFAEDTTAKVTLSVEKDRQKIEVTIPVKGNIIRSEQTSSDMYVSIDLVQEIIERQLKKYKNKLIDKKQNAASFSDAFIEKPDDGEEEVKIVRTKQFDIKPMYPEDACVQMELLGHDFYVFCNAETDLVSVVYKRKGGTYGLIEPEV